MEQFECGVENCTNRTQFKKKYKERIYNTYRNVGGRGVTITRCLLVVELLGS